MLLLGVCSFIPPLTSALLHWLHDSLAPTLTHTPATKTLGRNQSSSLSVRSFRLDKHSYWSTKHDLPYYFHSCEWLTRALTRIQWSRGGYRDKFQSSHVFLVFVFYKMVISTKIILESFFGLVHPPRARFVVWIPDASKVSTRSAPLTQKKVDFLSNQPLRRNTSNRSSLCAW